MAKYNIIPSSRTIVQSPISIGHKAEKGVEAIEFDLTAWVETYGSGTATIIMRRWGDEIPYPVALELDENNKATWTLSDIDTAKAGMAYAQVSYIVGDEVVKKSDIYTFRVMDSLTGEGEPPEAYDSWLENLTHLAAEAMAEVLDIEGIVTDKTLTVDGGIADGKATGDALALKADKSTTYTKTEVDRMIEGVEIETDTTLTIEGAAADAAETGRQIDLLNESLGDVKNATYSRDELYNGYKKVVPSYEHGHINSSGVYNPDTPRYISGVYGTADTDKVVNNSESTVYVEYFRAFTDFSNFTFGTYVTVTPGVQLTLAKQYPYFAIQGHADSTELSDFEGVYIIKGSGVEYLAYNNLKDVPSMLETVDDLGKLQVDIEPTEIQVGKYTNSPVGATVGIYSSTKFALGIFDVEPNTKYVVQTQGRPESTKYFAFANSANKVIVWIEQTVAADGDVFAVEVKSPEDAVKLYVNTTDDNSGQTAAQYIKLKKKLIQQDLDNTGDLISADQMRLALSAQKTFTSAPTNNYAGNRLPTFVHVADVHGDAVRFANAVGIADAVNADAILNTGDSVMYNPTDDLSFMADAMASADLPMLPLVGNHESYTQTEQQMYTNVIQPFATGLTLDTSVDYPTYYYRDFAEKNLRVIGVNQFQYRGVSNMTTQRHYHQAQIDFLCNALLSTPSGYGIIIMLHTPEAAPSKSAGYEKFYQDESLYGNTGGSIRPIYEIVDAYISGSVISKTYNNASGNTPASFTVNADFSGKNNTEFICYVSGHNHSDAVYYVTGVTNKQLMLNAVCTNCWSHRNSNGTEGSNYPYYCELSDLPRVSGTPTENAVNVYAIDRARKTVRIVRIGSDMPYSLGQKRDCMTIPYADVN